MNHFPLIKAGLIQRPKLKSGGAKVDRDECKLCNMWKLGQCDPNKQIMLPIHKVGHADQHLTYLSYSCKNELPGCYPASAVITDITIRSF